MYRLEFKDILSLELRGATMLAGASILAVAVWRVAASCLQSYLTGRFTVMHDLRAFGRPRAKQDRISGTAVVCGGSIAGLLAARVCLDHFDDVVIVEPEPWLGTEQGVQALYGRDSEPLQVDRHERIRVFQYDTGHAYQLLMLLAIRKAFPNADDTLREYGASIAKAEHYLHRSGVPIAIPQHAYPDGSFPECIFMTRESFELAIRRLVLKHSGRVRWVTSTVTALMGSADDVTSVTGVMTRQAQSAGEGARDVEIPATLVVDCTGGTCAGLKWLKRLDTKTTVDLYSSDLREVYHPHIRSVTFRFGVPPTLRPKLPIPGGYDNAHWLYTFLADPKLETRGMFASRIEGHRIEFVCGSWGDQNLPTEPAHLRGFIESLQGARPVPEWLLETVETLAEVDELDGRCVVLECAVPPCYWIHYENVKQNLIPSNFVALGDAVMRVNPVFSQGCTKACIGAVTLDGILRAESAPHLGSNFSGRFFAAHADRISGLWGGSKTSDYGYSSTEPVKGTTLQDGQRSRDLVRLVFQLVQKDRFVNSVLWHVRMMVAPQTDFFHPYIVFNIALLAIRERLGLA